MSTPSSDCGRIGTWSFSLVAVAAALVSVAAYVAPNGRVEAVATVGFTVRDMDRSVAFFDDVLGFEKVSDVEVAGDAYERLTGVFPLRMRVVRMQLGDEGIELTDFLAPEGEPFPEGTRSNDRSFQHIAIVVRDMARAYQTLREHGVQHVSSGPQRLPDWNPNAGGIEAFYFRDPDGHVLEIIAFPPGKGQPKWHAPTERLFLGIDHTAIGVWDTEASLAFYRDLLGFVVAGESENWGPEQERLNAVFGAHLRITGLRVARGPGIEFLEYLAPRDGNAAPADARPNDVMHWQTTLVTPAGDALARRLRLGRAVFVSPGIISTDGALGFRRGVMVRDPDGHVMRIVEQ